MKLKADCEIRRVVLCSGKVYYDLYEERERRGIDDIYLLRVEQLFPFPLKTLAQEIGRFKQAEIVWCQEEPKNQGAWPLCSPIWNGCGTGRLCLVAAALTPAARPPPPRRRG